MNGTRLGFSRQGRVQMLARGPNSTRFVNVIRSTSGIRLMCSSGGSRHQAESAVED